MFEGNCHILATESTTGPVGKVIADRYRIPTLMDRWSQLADIALLIADPRVRMLTLTGIAGVGKSRLAAAVLRRVGADCVTVAVDMADLDSRPAAWRAVSEAFRRAKRRAGDNTARAVASEAVIVSECPAANRAILLLDNCDRLASDIAEDIAEMLARCPNLLILATSRRALDLYEECLFRVGPLSCEPEVGGGPSSAARLLLRSIDTRHGNAADTVDRATLEEIVSAMGGVPMALESAANSIGRIGAARTLERITSGLPLLPTPYVDTPQRHRTIRDCMEWGIADVNESAIDLLLQIAISGTTTELEELLPFLGDEQREFVGEALAALVDHSMLDQDVADNGSATYVMSGLTRVFCRQLLREAPARQARIRRSRADMMLALATEIGRLLGTAEQRPVAMALMDRWLTDVIVAIHYLIDDGVPEHAVWILSILEDAWIDRGLLVETEAMVVSILATDDCRIDIAAQCQELLGRWALRSARFQDAARYLTKAAESADLADDPALESRVVRQLGEAYREIGDLGRARELFNRALDLPLEGSTRTAVQLAVAMADVGETRLPTDEIWLRLRAGVLDLENRRDRLYLLAALGRTLLRARAPHRALEVFHLVLSTTDPVRNLLEMVTALEGCVDAYRAVGPEYSEQIQRLTAAAHRIRDIYAIPQVRDAPWLVTTDAESVAGQDVTMGIRVDSVLEVGEAIAYALSAPLLSNVDIDSPVSRLTKRQLEIAHLVAEGLTNRMIATRLGIAEWTVINHLRQVMTKLDCPSRIHVALMIEREPQRSA